MIEDSYSLSREIVALIGRHFMPVCEEDRADRSSFERARAGFKLLADEKSLDPSILSHLRNAERFSDEDPLILSIVDRVRDLIDEDEDLANNLRQLLAENHSKDSLNLPEIDFSGDAIRADLSLDRRGMSEIMEAWRKNPAKLLLAEYLSGLDGRHDR